jgi:hypothetical protein
VEFRHSRAEECPFQVRCPFVNNKVILTKPWTKWRQDDANASGFIFVCRNNVIQIITIHSSSTSSFILFGIIQLGTYEIEKLITPHHVSWGRRIGGLTTGSIRMIMRKQELTPLIMC